MRHPLELRKFIFAKIMLASLVFALMPLVPQTHGQGQDLPGTAVQKFELIPAGSLIIPMDNVLQGNAGGTIFNLRAYGLANNLLQNSIPLKWAIAKGKAKDGTDFTASANKIQGVGGGAASITNFGFRGGPLIIHPAFTAQALPLINAFNNAINASPTSTLRVVVYQTTAPMVADIRYNLTHKPLVAIGEKNFNIHKGVMDDARIPNYAETVDTLITCNSCVTLVTQPHTDSPAAIQLIKQFTQCGGNFMAQCLATNTYENVSPFGQYQTTSGYVINNVATVMTYPNPDMPVSQFIGALKNDTGGAEQDWNLAAGSSFINNTFINAQNAAPHLDKYASTTSKLYYAGLGGITTYLGGHEYADSPIEEVNGKRILLNMVLQPATRPAQCGNLLGFPLIEGYKSVRLGTEPGDDVNTNGVINAGDVVEWTINYVNIGSFKSTSFQITDTIPSNTTYVNTPNPQPVVTHNGADGTTASANLAYNGTGNLLAPGAVIGVGGQVTVKIRTRINVSACQPNGVCQTVFNQAFATGTDTPIEVPTDNIDNTTGGLPPGVNVPPGSFPQDQLPPIDPTVVTLLAPSAAGVGVEGRVVATGGRGLSGVHVSLFDANTSQTRVATTNSFGFFRFLDLEIGNLYTMTAASKRYNFPSGPVTFVLDDNLFGITFVGVDSFADAPASKAVETRKADPVDSMVNTPIRRIEVAKPSKRRLQK